MPIARAAALRRAYAGAAAAWALALPLATLAAARSQDGAMVYGLTVGVYAIGSLICHQLPGRSFHLWSAQMPVCARCTGIYIGAAIAAVALSFRRAKALRHIRTDEALNRRTNDVAQGFSPAKARTVLAFAALPTIATLIYEWTTGVTPSNAARALAGLPIGAAVSWIVIR